VERAQSRPSTPQVWGLKTRTARDDVQEAEADRHEQEQDKHAQDKLEQELSSSGRQWRPSSSAPPPSSPGRTPSSWGGKTDGPESLCVFISLSTYVSYAYLQQSTY